MRTGRPLVRLRDCRGKGEDSAQTKRETRSWMMLLLLLLFIYLFTAVGFAPGGSSPTLVQAKTIKQQYTVVQHNTIKRKQNNTYIIQ
jgi:hypothetical protein